MRNRTRPLAAALAAVLLVGAPTALAAEPPPETSGAAALVVDARTGDEMYAQNAGRPRPIASATKLMTALLTLERADLGAATRCQGLDGRLTDRGQGTEAMCAPEIGVRSLQDWAR